MNLTPDQIDRAQGALLGQAVGDMLGVPYEFGSAPFHGLDETHRLGGGLGGYAPGEWSDDTQMAVYIARVAATGAELTSADALDAIADGFVDWYAGRVFSDIGIQTRELLSGLASRRGHAQMAALMRQQAEAQHARTGRTAGNGALMRNAVVGLTRLHDREATAASAVAVAGLTHADPLAGESCVLHAEMIRRWVLGESWQLEEITSGLGTERGQWWATALGVDYAPDQLERYLASPQNPGDGFTVVTLGKALLAVQHALTTDDPVATTFTTAITMSTDTDTVAAVAGALLGARLGATALRSEWLQALNGLPADPASGRRLGAEDLREMATRTALAGVGGLGV